MSGTSLPGPEYGNADAPVATGVDSSVLVDGEHVNTGGKTRKRERIGRADQV